MTDVVILPGVPALLPEYGSLIDPVADLRAGCLHALSYLVQRQQGPIRLLVDPVDPQNARRGVVQPLGVRVVEHLLSEVGYTGEVGTEHAEADAWVVVANGSARRDEKAPGHLDERSFDFDECLDAALAAGDGAALAALDLALGADLLAVGLAGLVEVGRRMPSADRVVPYFSSDEYGVLHWVVNWR